jgi:hypothetical protein
MPRINLYNNDKITCKKCKAKFDNGSSCHNCEKLERIKGIVCPCCKSSSIEEGGVYQSNGVAGPGYSKGRNLFPHLFCTDCGVIFKNLNEK